MAFMEEGEEFYLRTGELLNHLQFVDVSSSAIVKVSSVCSVFDKNSIEIFYAVLIRYNHTC